MVTGFNVDVKHNGKVYHVQTEDRGRKHPFIETLVYEGGKILHQEKVSYEEQNDDSHYDERAVARMVELQHKRTIDGILSGRFDPDRRPFGEEFISSRSFDECVLDFLVEDSKSQSLALSFVAGSDLAPGERAWVTVRASRHGSGEPIPAVTVRGRLIRSSGGPQPLDDTFTDLTGEARLEFDVPDGEGHVAIIVQAESPHGSDEIHKLLR